MGPKKRGPNAKADQSGLVFHRSLREAQAPIDAVAWSRVSGNFLTVDSLALRLWSTERQLKSLHRSAGSDDTLAFRTFGAFALETADDAFAIVYSAKRKGQVTSVQVWSSSLVLMHDVELSCPPLQLMALSPMRSVMQLVDVDSNFFFFKVTAASIAAAAAAATAVPQVPSYSKSKTSMTQVQHSTPLVTHFGMCLEQLILSDPENDEQVLGVTFIGENKFSSLDVRGIRIYARTNEELNSETRAVAKSPNKTSKRRNLEEIESESPFSVLQSIPIDFEGKVPCTFLCLDAITNKFLTAFFDGTIQILNCDPEGGVKVLGQSKAHECTPGNVECLYIELAQWQPSPGGFEFEVVSVGPDRKVVVLGCRANKSPSAASTEGFPLAYEMETIGSYYAQSEPPSHVARKEGNDKIGKVITLELSSSIASTSPCRRQLAVTIGGMLVFLNFHLPFRPIWRTNGLASISSAAMVPPPTAAESHLSGLAEQGENGFLANSCTLLLLVNGFIKVIDPSSGTTLREFDTLHLDQTRDPGAVFDRISAMNRFGPIGEDHAINSVVKFREGRATASYWCVKSSRIFVGYATGGIGFIDPNASRPMATAHIDTFKTHDASILHFLTFDQTIVVHRKSETKVFLLAGDEKGILSLWHVTKTKITKVYRAEAHKGAIISIQYLGDQRHKTSSPVIVTACRSGMVKAWVLNADGSLLLTSYFSASESMSAFVATMSVDSPINFQHRDPIMDGSFFASSDSITSASVHSSVLPLMQSSAIGDSIASSPIKPKSYGRNSASIKIVCICGMFSGGIEVWVLSSEAASMAPLWKERNFSSPITCLSVVKAFADDNKGPSIPVLCASLGGSAIIFEISSSGKKIRNLNYFSLPFDIRQAFLVPFGRTPLDTETSVVFVSDDTVLDITPNENCDLPGKRTQSNRRGMTDEGEEGPAVKNEEETSGVLDERSSNEYPDFEDYENSSFSREVHDAPVNLDEQDSQKLDTSVRNQRQVENEYHFIRKDRKFIELFQHNQQGGRNQSGFLLVGVAVSVIHEWLNADSIGQNAIRQLLRHLGVSDDDRMDFVKVAKVAAIATIAVKKKLEETSTTLADNRMWADYRRLKQNRRTITYNSVGEPIHFEKDLKSNVSDGILNGSVIALRAELSKQPSRAIPISVPTKLSPTLLHTLPKKFGKLVLKDVQLPISWDPAMNHWLDLRRTVRVARTLLDMRTTKQHELSLCFPRSRSKSLKIQSLPKLLALYYERNFGSIRLNVASHKIVHYLEACLQYVQWPIVGILQRFLCPTTPIEEFSDRCLWIMVELRKMLFTRGSVVDGDPIPAINVMGDIEEKDDENDMLLKWQMISKSDAQSAVNEMFVTRGNYGPSCVQRLLDITRSLPSIFLPQAIDDGEYIDLEQFLYAIIAEFTIIEHFIGELDQVVFGLKSIPNHKVSTSRDINFDSVVKVSVNLTDRDAKVSLSLDRIRALTEQFVFNDPSRSGAVDEVTFRSIVVIAGDAILGFECGRDAHKLVDMCVRKFKSGKPDSDMCYLDFWATLLAYIPEFQGGDAGLNGNETLKALSSDTRGLDVKQASSLSLLIEYMQCPQQVGYTWTTGIHKSNSEAADHKKIPKGGTWKRDVSIQLELPGSLSAHEFQESATVSIIPPRVEVKEQLNAALTSSLLESNRSLTTLSGEIFKPSKAVTRLEEKVPLHLTDLSVGAFLSGSELMSNLGAKAAKATSSSSSASANVTAGPRRFSKVLSVHSDSGNELGFYPSIGSEYEVLSEGEESSLNEERPKSGLSGLAHQYQAQSASSLLPQNNKLAAFDGMEKRRIALLTENEALMQMQQREQEEFDRRREMRKLHGKKSRFEHRAKEKVWMEFKEKEDALRSERKHRAIELYEKALKAQRDDERKAANVQMEKLLEEKMRAKRIKAEREAKEREELERVRELDERLYMKKEEHRSMEVEAAIAEKLRIEREKAEKAAAEAEKKAAEERERLRLEEEARKVQEEKDQALRDAAIALKEGLLMAQQDFNILLIPEPEPEPPEPEPEPEPAERPFEEPVPDEAVDEDIKIIEGSETPWLTMRMTTLVGKLKAANDRHFAHPRWSSKESFFMPQLFTHDITFQPFDSTAANQAESLSTWTKASIGKPKVKIGGPSAVEDTEESKAGSSFDDVSKAVQEHKLLLIRERLEQLYQTSSSEASPADWTEVFRVAVVDWGTFFHEQQDILYERPTTPPPVVDEEASFLAAMKKVTVAEPESKRLAESFEVPQTLLATFDQNSPEPLPFARVARGVVNPSTYKYYQAEIVDNKTYVTIELKVEKGFAELLVSDSQLPTTTNYWKRAQAELFNKRIARLSFSTNKAKSIFVGVHSQEGAQYQLWIYSSGDPDMTSHSSIQQVSKCLREFDLLSNQPMEFLHVKMPALIQQAKKIVEFENKMAKPSILGDLQSAIESGAYVRDRLGADEDLDEIEIMDSFISKAGRRLMRKDFRERESTRGGTGETAAVIAEIGMGEGGEEDDDDDDEIGTEQNPNDHVELFPPPKLGLRQSFLELINQHKLSDKDSAAFALHSLSRRHPPNSSMSKSLSHLPEYKPLRSKPPPTRTKLPLITYKLSNSHK